MTGNGFIGLTPAEAEADLQAAAARTRLTMTVTPPAATAAERLRDAHRQHVEANTRLTLASRELTAADDAATKTGIALEQAKRDLIDDTLSLYYGTHR